MLRDYFYSGHEKNKRRRVRKCCATMGSRHHQSFVGFGEIAFTSRHQKCKPQMEQRSAGGHDVIECEECRETITRCKSLTSPCRKAEPIR